MKMLSVKIHTDIVMVVPDDYDVGEPNLIEAIAESVKQDLVNVFDDKMVTIQEVETVQDIPQEYLNVEPWMAPDVDATGGYSEYTCKQLLESRLHSME